MTFWDFVDKHHDDIFLLIFVFGVLFFMVFATKYLFK